MHPDPEQQRIKIAVFCILSSEPTVRKTLSYHFPEWEKINEISVVPVLDQWRTHKPHVRRIIDDAVPKHSEFVQLIFLDGLEWGGQIGGGDDMRQLLRMASLDEFGKKIPAILRGVGLDWLTHTEYKLSKWRHGTVDKSHIGNWLQQFDRLASHRWVGEGLLKVIDFWPEDRLIESVGLTAEALADFDRVCFQQNESGKSADVLANLFAKQIKPLNPKFPKIENLYDVLTDSESPAKNKNILFIEDGLFSGTEMTKVFSDLLGITGPDGRGKKVEKLDNQSQLRDKNIKLLFPVATSFGVARLNKFLADHNLINVEVCSCPYGHIEVLSAEGKEAFRTDCFFEPDIRNCPTDPDSFFVKVPFQDMTIWKDANDARRAANFCRDVGGKLFRQYLQAQNWQWHETKIQRCALGMYGMGLAFAFAHSVPKASLPLFWATGMVKGGKRSKAFKWEPLFPNAA